MRRSIIEKLTEEKVSIGITDIKEEMAQKTALYIV